MIIFIIFVFSGNVSGFDNKIAHRFLTDEAIEKSELKTNGYLEDNLNLSNGLDTTIDGLLLREWIWQGSRWEDEPMCRASNHFHNPRNELPWKGTDVSNPPGSGMSDEPWFIESYCMWSEYPPISTTSNVHWATGYTQPAPTGIKEETGNQWDWDHARESYYIYLTGKDYNGNMVAGTQNERDEYFGRSLQSLGQVLHLLQDMAVPAHVRNDFKSHLDWAGITPNTIFRPTKWFYERFEYFVEHHIRELIGGSEGGDLTDKTLTKFWDTNNYTGDNPSISSQSIGLSEYTNINFASKNTVFAEDFLNDDDSSNDVHYNPYPRKSSTNLQEYINNNKLPETVISEDGAPDTSFWIEKTEDGEILTHFLKPTYFARPMIMVGGYDPEVFDRCFKVDDICAKNYAEKLIPRAVGYSAALLDYFFRGSIEISLPDKGTYVFIDDPDQDSFSSITLRAQNTSPEGEEMSDGSIVLVIKYKVALDNPFQNYSYPVPTTSEFSYIVVPEANNVRSIPRNSPSELTFDLTNNPLPLWATDVYLQIVYKGQLGSEAEGIAVGLKDISEPTPVDIINSMDKICLYDNWYDAGSPEAIALVDANNNGIADTDEWDVYSHDIENIYFTFLPTNDQHFPSCTEEDIYIQNIPGGDYHRMFILSDYDYCYSFCAVSVVHTNPDDLWGFTYFPPSIYCSNGIKNQTELADPEVCLSYGVNPPCYIRHYPTFTTIRGIDNWTGINYQNSAFPQDSSCDIESLN